jgi:sarcosine oxidase
MIGSMPDDRRCIVVGAGLLGLSSAWALSRRGWDVVVLEAARAPGHERSGSKGDARIFRLGYPEPHYAEMAVLARERWRDLEGATGLALLHVTGQVTLGDDLTLQAIADALAAVGSPVEQLSASAAAQRFPGIATTGPVLVEADSGVLAADACLQAFRQAGRFDLRTGDVVTSLRQSPGGAAVDTADGTSMEADIVVDCAGPAALGLLDLAPPAGSAPSLPQVAYFASRQNADGMPPVFIEWGDAMIYGLPVPDGGAHAGTYKVSCHAPGSPLDAFDPADPGPLAGDDPILLAQLTEAVKRLLPSLAARPLSTERCVYDNSADTDFILARTGRIVVGCGTSGHGFKFGPLLGELLADLADGATPSIDLRPFGLHRDPAPPPRPAHQSR